MRLILALLVLLPGLARAQPDLAVFSDIAGSRYRESITLLQARGLFGGFPDGTFRPLQAMTRSEFLALVLRASGQEDAPVGGQCLAEFPSGAWYAPVMCQGLALGIIDGEAGASLPQNTVTYAEALKMVSRAFGFPVADGPDEWFRPYVEFAAESGIMSVLEYRPRDFVTREVAAGVLYRSLVVAGETLAALPAPQPELPVTPVPTPQPEPSPVPEPLPEPAPAPLPAPAPTPVPVPDPPALAACAPGHVAAAPQSLRVGGRDRQLLTHLPANVGSGQSHALVVAFHGRTNSNAQVQSYMRLDASATDAIVVYPAGLPASGGTFNWHDPGDLPAELRDYELFDAIVQEFGERYCVDPERIFVVGHSLGAYFANSVACARAGTVRAVASVAGGIMPSDCTGRVAAMLFHNPNDALVAISEGERARDTFLATNQAGAFAPQALGDAFNCAVYNPSDPDSSVIWCPHGIDRPYGDRYDPHSWPASIGPHVMDFFSRF